MKVPLLDLKSQYESIRDETESAVKAVLESQYFILGPKVKEFEESIASYCGVKFAVGCASGTDALLLALIALDVGAGDEVITTPYTFFSTASSITRLGARPVFCDIVPETFNIDPASIESRITRKTKAILVVHLFGLIAEMGKIKECAERRGIPIVEDAAQAVGAAAPEGKAGAIGAIGCFSFFPSKNLGGAGDGGMVVTNDSILAEKVRLLRAHGAKPKYYHSVVGINSRLDELQAAILQVKFSRLEGWSRKRRENALYYNHLFTTKGCGIKATLPFIPEGYTHIFNQYVIRTNARDSLREYLLKKGVGTEIYYPVPLHMQECFSYLGYRKGEFPESEKAAETSLALPIYPELTHQMQDYVVDCIEEYFRS